MNKREKAVKLLILEKKGFGHTGTVDFEANARECYEASTLNYGKKEEFPEFMERYKKYIPQYIEKEIEIICEQFTHSALDKLLEVLELGIIQKFYDTRRRLTDEVDEPLNELLYAPYLMPHFDKAFAGKK